MENDSDPGAQTASSSHLDGGMSAYHGGPMPEVLRRPDIRKRQARLANVIAEAIIPRLLLIHQNARVAIDDARTFTPDEIAEFGKLTMAADNAAALAYFDRMRARGHSLDTLFVNLLAPTARHLGELWDRDLCDFIDVAIGVARLQELLTIFGAAEDVPLIDLRHRAYLVSTPGEKHLFGVDMVAKLMRGAGWDVTIGKGLSPTENAREVARDWYGVFGMTLSGDAGLQEVGRTIDAVRRSSLNRRIGVMVGGPAFTGHPDLAIQVGADAVADDAPAAVILAAKLLLVKAICED